MEQIDPKDVPVRELLDLRRTEGGLVAMLYRGDW